MKILVVSQHYYPENFRITDICEELVKMGHTVDVICGLPNYPDGVIPQEYRKKNKWEEIINGVNLHRCFEIGRGNSKLKLFLNYYSVCLSMRKKAKKIKNKYDLVFINQLSPVMVSWAGLSYARKHKVPCVMYCYDLWPDSLAAGGIGKNNIIFKYFFKVSNKCYKGVDKIFVTSQSFIDYFIKTHGIHKDKLSYLPQYCEDLFSNVKIGKKNDNIINYVFAGNIGQMQSVETIIEAARYLLDYNIKIHIVGDGSNLANCRKIANEYKLDNVIFYGKRPLEDMPKFYSLADAMIVTLSKNEVISNTLPGKVQSYMCAGKPIVGCIDGETQLIIKDANCGLCCDSEDYISLADILKKMATMNLQELGINSKKYYEKNFTKKLFFEKLNKEFNDMGDNYEYF